MRFVRGHHNIFVPTYRELLAPNMKVGLEGIISVDLIHARTGLIRRHLEFKNLIVNTGLDGMVSSIIANGASASLTRYCAVGTGNTAPVAGDTTLQAEISTRAQANSSPGTVYSYVAGPPDYFEASTDYLFLETAANGNLTEVGFFSLSAAGVMFSRQLFKDELGNPTTVTKTSADQLRITYKIRVYPMPTDVVLNNQDISGTLYTVTCRAQRVGDVSSWRGFFTNTLSNLNGGTNNRYYTGALPARNGSFPSGAFGNPPGVAAAAYVTGSFQQDVTYTWQPADGTGTALCTIASGGVNGLHGIGFSPGLAKDSTKRLVINYRMSWGRHV